MAEAKVTMNLEENFLFFLEKCGFRCSKRRKFFLSFEKREEGKQWKQRIDQKLMANSVCTQLTLANAAVRTFHFSKLEAFSEQQSWAHVSHYVYNSAKSNATRTLSRAWNDC